MLQDIINRFPSGCTHTVSPSLLTAAAVWGNVCLCLCATPCKNNKSTSLPLSSFFYLIISPSVCLSLCPPPLLPCLSSLCLHSSFPCSLARPPPTPPLLFEARRSRLLKMSSVEKRLCCKQRGKQALDGEGREKSHGKKDIKITHKLNNLISLYSALFLTSEASSMFL